jgi:hypothetical protein
MQKAVTPRTLGYLGLIPFVVLSLLTAVGPEGWKSWALPGLVAYGAVILSFLGGITWGIAIRADASAERLFALSLVPFFLAWVAVLLPAWAGIWLLVLAFLLALFNDYAVSQLNLSPAWFRTLRTVLTVVVVICLVLAAVSI